MLITLNNTIGNNLIRLREERNLKQYEAAEQIGISRQTLALYETPDKQAGNHKPSLETLRKIAQFYGVSIDYLCGDIPGTTHDISFIMEYTGLSADAVERLRELKTESATTVLPRFGPEDWTEEKDGMIIRHIGNHSDCIDVNLAGILDKLLRNDDFVKLLKQLSKMDASTDSERVTELTETLNTAHEEMRKTRGGSAFVEKLNRYNELVGIEREYYAAPRLAKLDASSLFTNIMNTLWPTD